MAEYSPVLGRSASVAELWAAVRQAGRPGRRAGLPRGLAAGLALAILAAAASAALMGLAGWLIVRSAQTGLSVTSTFSWIFPAAGVEALAVVRTATRYGERLTTHGATLQVLARLRARVFASATRMTPRQLRRFHSGDLLDRVQADIDSLDRVVLAVAVPAVVAAIVGASSLAVLALIRPGVRRSDRRRPGRGTRRRPGCRPAGPASRGKPRPRAGSGPGPAGGGA